ncbi:MAG: YlmC/YmxH family sporulation protein [Clostridia bacterium]|nr:YlmC/YmxH family sporulation protein [Clostridia bacterium]
MNCCIDELCNKDVISIETGCRIGYVCDVEVDTVSGNIAALLVTERSAGFSLKRSDCFRIAWCDIVVMGEETILVRNIQVHNDERKSSRSIFNLFSK